MTDVIVLTVEQLETLAARARERGAKKAVFYMLDSLLVEVVGPEGEHAEAIVEPDGRIYVEVSA